MLYQRTQPGTAIVIALLIGIGLEALVALRGSWSLPTVLVALLLAASAIVFSTMTIAVSNDRIEWWFQFGLLHRSILLSQVQLAVSGRVSFLSGLGIRTDGRNWLWLVSGRNVVKLQLRNGKNVSLGSPEAQTLAVLIDNLISSHQ